MKKLFTLFAVLLFATAHSQCHVDTIPLADNAGGTCYITNLDVDFTPISTSTYQGTGNSYQSFSSPYVMLQQGGTHQFDIQGVNGTDYTIAAWLDMNNDSIFAGSEQLFVSANEVNTFFQWPVYIPFSTIADTLHLRIIKQENAFGWGWGNDDACIAPGTGEVEDYMAIVNCANYDPVALVSPTTICYDDSVMLEGIINFGDITWYTGSPMSPVFTSNLPFWLNLPPGTTDTMVYFRNTGPGCFSGPLDSAQLTILPSPIANITSPDTIQSCSAVTVNAQPGPYNFMWSTGDTTATITINYALAGSLSLWVTDTSNGCTSTDGILVAIAPDPPANYAYVTSGLNFCYNYEVSLLYDSLLAPGSCTWYTYPGNLLVGTGSNLTYILPDTGTYQFMACVNSICGIDTMIHSFYANTATEYDSIYSPDGNQDATGAYVMCYSNTGYASIIVSGLQGTVQDWFIGDTTTWFTMNWPGDTIISLPISLMSPGQVYFAYAVVMNYNGCLDTTEMVFAKLANTINFNLADSIYTCSFPVTIGQQAPINYGVYDVLWSTGDTLAPLTVASPGTFWIYTYDNVSGCTMYDTITVADGTNVQGPFADTTVACLGYAAFDLGLGGYQLGDWFEYDDTWNFINSISDMYYMVGFSGNNSWLIVNTVTQHGCTIWDTTYINFNATFSFSLGPDITTTTTPVVLNGPPGYSSYMWSPSNVNSPTLQVYTSGTYYLTVDNGQGCQYTDTIVVNILPTSTGISSLAPESTVYPNPANNFCVISSATSISVINLYDAEGRLVNTTPGQASRQVEINTESLAAGIYIVEVVIGESVSRSKLVIHRGQ